MDPKEWERKREKAAKENEEAAGGEGERTGWKIPTWNEKATYVLKKIYTSIPRRAREMRNAAARMGHLRGSRESRKTGEESMAGPK